MTLAAAGAAAEESGGAPVGKAVQPCPLQSAHIELELKNADGSPVADVAYVVTDKLGHKHEGKLDKDGAARVDFIPPGFCTVWFDAPGGDDEKPPEGAPGKHFKSAQKPAPCKTDEKHTFHVSDWGTDQMVIDHAAAAEQAADLHAKNRGAEEEAEGEEAEEWDLKSVGERS
jgi:hypothetical protein